MLLFKLQFYQLGWFWAFGVEDTHMEDDELKVYLKWTLHVLIYCTQLHIERSLLLFSDMHIRQKCQWTSLGRIKSSRLRLFFDDVPEKIACSGLLLSERLEQATEKKGMDLWK